MYLQKSWDPYPLPKPEQLHGAGLMGQWTGPQKQGKASTVESACGGPKVAVTIGVLTSGKCLTVEVEETLTPKPTIVTTEEGTVDALEDSVTSEST